MRTYETFILGAITGGLVAWLWGKEITGYMRERTRGVRTQAAEGLQAVAEGTGAAFDRGGAALQRAEGILQDTKAQVGEALRSAQDAIRPAATARDA